MKNIIKNGYKFMKMSFNYFMDLLMIYIKLVEFRLFNGGYIVCGISTKIASILFLIIYFTFFYKIRKTKNSLNLLFKFDFKS